MKRRVGTWASGSTEEGSVRTQGDDGCLHATDMALRRDQSCQQLDLKPAASRTVRLSVEQATRPVVLCYESPRRPMQCYESPRRSMVYLYQRIQEGLSPSPEHHTTSHITCFLSSPAQLVICRRQHSQADFEPTAYTHFQTIGTN